VRTEHVDILLPEYLRGTLNGELTARVEEHLRTCQICKFDLDELEGVFTFLDEQASPAVSKAYFGTILPKVRERLEEQRTKRWSLNPLVSRVLMPLSAAAVTLIMLWHTSIFTESPVDDNPLQAVVGSATPDEIAQIVQDQYPMQDWSVLNSNIISRALASDRFVKEELIKEALTSESTSPFNIIADISPQQFFVDLDDSEVDEVLQGLSKMEIL
jgi:hypothetical protein